MFFAAIYVPDLPAEAIVRSQPELAPQRLRERAIAVVEGAPPMQLVVAANEAARQAGVEPGMTRLQAQARAAEVRLRSRAQEEAAHAALLDCAQSFSPRVEDTAADTLVLDLDGLDRLFGPPAKIARDLARRVSEVGVEAHVAVASNPDAAVHAARGFPGVTVIPPGKEAERLGGLPVDVLDPSPEMLETLDRWGVRNLRALAALPEVAVTERLGQDGLRLQRLARGALRREIVVAEPALHFEETLELEHPVELLEPLAFLLGRLLERLCARLGTRALATNELRLELALEPQISDFRCQISDLQARDQDQSAICNLQSEIFIRTLRLPVPMLDSRIFLKLLQLDLKAHPPQAPVRKATLAAEPVQPRVAQGGLFLPRAPEPERLELTLARIQGVVGAGNVGAAELLDTHRPDAFRMKKFVVQEPGLKPRPQSEEGVTARRKACPDTEILPAATKAAPFDCAPCGTTKVVPSRSVAPTLALRVFRPAVRVIVEVRGGRPVRLNGAVKGEVVSCSGPWRRSGEWWRESGQWAGASGQWDRDEWDVVLAPSCGNDKAAVALYRIFRDARTGHWFVQGTYD